MRSLRMAASWQLGVPASARGIEAERWRFQARCADSDPDLFFPIGSTGPAVRQAMRAKAICTGCPVRRECLEWALDTEQPHGVWGGLDEHERHRLRTAGRRLPPNATPAA